MLGTLKKIFAFAGNRKGLLKKSLFFSFLNGIFASFQFGALYFIVDALASDNHSLTSVWLALGMMMLSIAGRIFSSFFSMNEQTVVGYGMVADKRISIGDRLRYIPMGYFNKNNIGTITGIVTTTLGDVESSAPVALVNMIGGFFNSVVLILFLLLFNWQLGLVALVGVVCYLLVTGVKAQRVPCSTVAGGVIGEILYSVLGRRTTKATMVGSSFALVGLALGEYIPFIWMQDAYRSMLVNDDSGLLEIAEWCMNIVSVPVMIVLCVATVILTCLGVLWGNKIVKKRLSNAE